MRRREFIAGFGSAAAWPAVTRAQQRTLPLVGFLASGFEIPAYLSAFRQGLNEQGFADGRNIEIVYSFAETQYDRLPALSAELVRKRVAVIATDGGTSSVAAKATTTTVPIVFAGGVDPIRLGLVASLNRPGGNVTGATVQAQALVVKRVELLHEIMPSATAIGALVNPANPQAEAR
jgi:putative ABC transport system substrate-binding protein